MEASDRLEKRLRLNIEPIAFGDDDLEGTTQPYDDELVMTSRIGGFIGKKSVGRSGEWG